MSDYWLEHCPPPRPRDSGAAWDVFISYRSVNRTWAIALYDMLVQARYAVFLDQFVMVPGGRLAGQLEANLELSASGAVLWSADAKDSDWVAEEYSTMRNLAVARRGSGLPFHIVVAKLDSQALPAFAQASVHVDFSSYPDGPSGADLIRLAYALRGQPVERAPLDRILAYETAMKEEPSRLRALATIGRYDDIERRALGDAPAYTTSAALHALAADRLIAGGRYDAALRVIEHSQAKFRNSIRLKQLKGLALRRAGRNGDALLELETLRQEGHQDPETLGILAACWADVWKARCDGAEAGSPRDALERSRDLYRFAFEAVPSDTYVGINAASKSALLGEFELAQALALAVLKLVAEGKEKPTPMAEDYWTRATEAEAHLLCGDWDLAVRQFHDARIAHQMETGSIATTASQALRLAEVLPIPELVRAQLESEFKDALEARTRA